MFTLNTASGVAAINGLGQVLVFPSEAAAQAHADAADELRGVVKPVATYAPDAS